MDEKYFSCAHPNISGSVLRKRYCHTNDKIISQLRTTETDPILPIFIAVRIKICPKNVRTATPNIMTISGSNWGTFRTFKLSAKTPASNDPQIPSTIMTREKWTFWRRFRARISTPEEHNIDKDAKSTPFCKKN